MKEDLNIRVIEVSNYIISTNKTIRDTAKVFKVSKSTIHKDISERLKEIDMDRYEKVENIFKNHIETRHILGGESTKKKYLQLKKTSRG